MFLSQAVRRDFANGKQGNRLEAGLYFLSIFLFQIFALVSLQTRICFGTMRKMAIQTFKRFFSNSYFPAVLVLTTVLNFRKTFSVMTNTSAIVKIMLCHTTRMGSFHKHDILGKDLLPLQQLVHLLAVTVGCKPGLGWLDNKICSSEKDFSKC